jgi:hypothetical protein
MKINNPRSMVDFIKGNTNKTAEQNLATIGQLYTIANKVVNRLENEIKGKHGHPIGSCGYAWLGEDGKLPVHLLPALAISETHVISEDELKLFKNASNIMIKDGKYEVSPRPGSEYDDESGEYAIHNYLSFHTDPTFKAVDGWLNLQVQKGDIIVVHPGNVGSKTVTYTDPISGTASGTITFPTDEYINGSEEIKKGDSNAFKPDTRYSGSYIISNVSVDSTVGGAGRMVWDIVKISYTDGNIVEINGLVPSNSAGAVTIDLKSIIDQTDLYTSGEETKVEVTDAVKRLRFGYEDDQYRFCFLDDGKNRVPYTKLTEHEDLSGQVYSIANSLSTIIATYKNEHNEEVNFLSSTIDKNTDYLSSVLGGYSTASAVFEADKFLSSVIGSYEATESNDETAAIIPQIKSLRSQINNNLITLNNSRCNTNAYLAQLRDDIVNIYSRVNDNAVSIKELTFKWGAPDFVDIEPEEYKLGEDKLKKLFTTSVTKIVRYDSINVFDNVSVKSPENTDLSDISTSMKTTGYRRWTLHYFPRYLIDGKLAEKDYTDATTGKTIHSVYNPGVTKERLLAIFDSIKGDIKGEFGEQFFPDIEYTITQDQYQDIIIHISVNIDVTYEDGVEKMNNLEGACWTMYLAQTISKIKQIYDRNYSFNVGGENISHADYLEHLNGTGHLPINN